MRSLVQGLQPETESWNLNPCLRASTPTLSSALGKLNLPKGCTSPLRAQQRGGGGNQEKARLGAAAIHQLSHAAMWRCPRGSLRASVPFSLNRGVTCI